MRMKIYFRLSNKCERNVSSGSILGLFTRALSLSIPKEKVGHSKTSVEIIAFLPCIIAETQWYSV